MSNDPAGWRGSELRADPSWVVELAAEQRSELVTGKVGGLLPALEHWRRQLQSGLGVLLVRGVPVEELSEQQARDVFTLIGRQLGDPVSQNKDGDLITDIQDVGNDPADPDVRLYTTAAEQDFHTDGADLTPEQDEVLGLYEQTANEPDLYLDMDFRPGDMQWIRNAVVLHKRTAYVDWPQPGRRRHLLRLWLTARDFTDGDDRLRDGIPHT